MTGRDQGKAGHRGSIVSIILVLAAMFFTIRIQNTETLVTNDEPFWLGRSANFYRALVHNDFERTYQMAHPGVPVMWAGAIAYWIHESDYAHPDPGNVDAPFSIDRHLVLAEIDPISMLQQARVIKLVMETALFAISIGIVASLGSRTLGVIAGILIVIDPFHAGFGPLLHVDSLFAMSLFTASLAIAWAFSNVVADRARLWRCLVAGGLAAIAVLTRMTGLVIALPLLVGAFMLWRQDVSTTKSVLKSVGLWIAGFAVTFILAWPAIWVAPIATMRAVIDWSLGAANEGHEHALFFNGAIHDGDPGFWFYPVTLLWRTTPVIWIGLLALLIGLRNERVRKSVRSFLPVIVMGAAILLIMTAGAKKFDRYILPSYPVIALMAAFGFQAAIEKLRTLMPALQRWAAPVVIAAITFAGAWSLGNAGPYRLNYYNEVMRGFQQPQQAIQIGWGEGGHEVIAFLEEESERLGRPVVMHTRSVPPENVAPPLRYHLIDDAVQTENIQFRNLNLSEPDSWHEIDYYVFNIQQTQRDMIPDYRYFSDVEPVHTVSLGGVVIWEIYVPLEMPVPNPIPGS